MNILSLNDAHDASACIMINGEIVAGMQEERATRLKGDYGYPKHSIDFCLEFPGLKREEIDYVCIPSRGWNPVLIKLKRNANFETSDWIREQHEYWKYELGLEKKVVLDYKAPEGYSGLNLEDVSVNYYDIYKERAKNWKLDEYYPFDHLIDNYVTHGSNIIEEVQKIRIKYIQEQFPKSKIKVVTHEDAHTYYSYYGSHLAGEEVLALTAEGIGDYSNSTISVFNLMGRKEISYSTEARLATIYQYITLLLGMKPAQHEYKVMGLAPYANKREVEKSYVHFKDVFRIDEQLRIMYKDKPRDLYFHFRDALEGHRFDGIAGALQKWTEEILCEWVEKAVERTGIRKLVCGGGVFQNIKAGKAISELDCVDDISILPITGDASTAIGACYYQNEQSIKWFKYVGGGFFYNTPSKSLKHVYLGPDVYNIDLSWLVVNFKDYEISVYNNKEMLYTDFSIGSTLGHWDEKTIAKLLSQGKIIARCSGRMEFGHRALGNRSIMADPRDPKIVRKLNDAIKFRDWFMPFTPSVIGELNVRRTYFMNNKNLDARFMCMAFETTESGKRDLPAAIHSADQTIRPQLIDRETNPKYWDIVNEFGELTGVYGILNTSFNLSGEPIVCNAEDAIHTFENSGLDGLILGDCLVMRKE